MELQLDDRLESLCPGTLGAAVEITTTDGRRVAREVLHAKGDPRNPLTDAEVEEKFTALAVDGDPAGREQRERGPHDPVAHPGGRQQHGEDAQPRWCEHDAHGRDRAEAEAEADAGDRADALDEPSHPDGREGVRGEERPDGYTLAGAPEPDVVPHLDGQGAGEVRGQDAHRGARDGESGRTQKRAGSGRLRLRRCGLGGLDRRHPQSTVDCSFGGNGVAILSSAP